MNYLPICFVLSVAILYVLVGLPPSTLSKAAVVVLGIALMYLGSRAMGSQGPSWEDELEAKDQSAPGGDDAKSPPPS